MRSLLFVPADSPRKIGKGLGCGADALILDLEDSVAAAAKQAGREGAADVLRAQSGAESGPQLIVRVNALDTGLTKADLAAVAPLAPFAIMLPKAEGAADVQLLSTMLSVHEAEAGLPDGAIRILPIVTETPTAMFHLAGYRGASARLMGLTWGAEDLAAGIGAETNRDPDMAWSAPFALARNMMLFAAASAEVDAIDTVFAAFRDAANFERECRTARRDGFVGKMAIHPDQVPVINEVFTPPETEVQQARAIVAAFTARPGAGVLAMNGAMIDRPHLRKAERLLMRVGRNS